MSALPTTRPNKSGLISGKPYAAKYGPRGLPKLQRMTGDFVDLVKGELIPTPWRVVVDRGVVTIHRRAETTPCMFGVDGFRP